MALTHDRWKIMADYAYGINAIRNGHRGANSVGVLLQMDLGKPGKHSPLSTLALAGFQKCIFHDSDESPCMKAQGLL